MKKIFTLTLLASAFLGASLTAQQGMTADEALNPTPAARLRAQQSATVRTAAQSTVETVAGGGCDSILTTYAAGNGNSGIMFNIVAVQPMTITFFDCLLVGDTGWTYIYRRSGTFVGNETNAAAWTLVDSAFVVNSGVGTPTRIPVYVGHAMNTGDTTGFYISADGNTLSVDYTNGTAVNNVFAQDLYVKVLEGRGMSSPLFSTSAMPRVFNGNVYYCPPDVYPCNMTTTTFAGGNGNDGNMFDITATSDVMINGFYGNFGGTGYVKIYYRNGTYVGNEANAGAWTFIDSAMITGTNGVPTLIPIPVNVAIANGQTVAFYITGTATGAAVDYTDGTTEGAVYTDDGLITVKEGKGVEYPFGTTYTPRIWNGTIDYCMGITSVTEPGAVSATTVNVFPNPFNTTTTFLIQTEQPVNNMQLSIYDGAGRLVRQVNNINTTTVTVDRDGLADGMYFYTLTAENAQLTNGKLIVE
jgi:hypothetical protein